MTDADASQVAPGNHSPDCKLGNPDCRPSILQAQGKPRCSFPESALGNPTRSYRPLGSCFYGLRFHGASPRLRSRAVTLRLIQVPSHTTAWWSNTRLFL